MAMHPLLRVVAVCILASALLGLREVPRPEPRRHAGAAATYERNPERVAVRVDGWIIEVDQVAAIETEPPAEVLPRVAVVRRSPGATISNWDRLIHHHAAAEGLDWRLIAALIFEESRFKSDSVSPKGAVGLMQVRPVAAEDVGETFFREPADNIRTGIRYLKRLDGMFAAAAGRDRLAIVLAAYNMGPAHVQDAQLLARQYGFDPHRWDNALALMLPLLEDSDFHRRLPAGYAQGRATVTYVERILTRFERYKAEADAVPGLASDPPAGPKRRPG